MADTTMVFWIVLWTVAMLGFLSPLCWTTRRRQLWCKIFTCRWREVFDFENNVGEVTQPAPTEEVFHYRLSKSQEDDIRESFLVEKMRFYTQEITEADIMRKESCEDSRQGANQKIKDLPPGVAADEIRVSLVNDDPGALIEDGQGVDDIEMGTPVKSRKRADSSGDLSTSDLGDELVGELGYDECDSQFVSLPSPGQCRRDLLPKEEYHRCTHRQVPNGCAICLSVFQPTDDVTWSSNPDCNHVFHHKCILDWLHASGRKALRRQRRNNSPGSIVNYSCDPVARITRFPALCPCCRQEFIRHSSEEDVVVDKDSDSASEPSTSHQGRSEADTSTIPPSDEELSTDQSHEADDIREISVHSSTGGTAVSAVS